MAITLEQANEARTKAGLEPLTQLGVSPVSSSDAVSERLQRFRQAVTQGKEDRSAATYGSSFPASTTDTPLQAGLKATGNVPSSAFNLASGIYQAVRHPIDTGKGIVSAVKGSGEALGRTLVEKTKFGDIQSPNGKTLRENAQQLAPDIDEKTFNTLVDSLHERYGSLENAQRTATNDPFGFGADVMSILSGGAGLAKNIPGVAETASRIAAPIEEANMAVRNKVGGAFQESAQKNVERILEPTKEEMKMKTQKILPELTSRNKIAWNREGLAAKYADELEASGRAIDDAWQQLPPGTQENVKPIISGLEESKNKFIVNGVVVDPTAWKAADELQQIVMDVSKGSDTIPSESLRKVRQIWDESISRSKGHLKDLSDQDRVAIKREATDAIRKVLAEAHPEIAKLNQEYTLWKRAGDVLEETMKRKKGQGSPLGNKMLSSAAIGGGTASAGLKGAAIGVAAVSAITLAMQSTLWKTLSAAAKNRLARAIIERNPADIGKVLRPIIGDQALGLLKDANDNAQQ